MATKNSSTKTRKTDTNGHANGALAEQETTAAVLVTKPVTGMEPSSSEATENLYDDAVKEIVALAENESYARRIDNGPLSEARGKDTWSLHSQLRAIDQLNANVIHIRGGLVAITDELRGDTRASLQGLNHSVEELLSRIDNETERRIEEFRDETLRLIDKRFNQADVAFATVRAEIEIVKALVTGLINERIGRSDGKSHR